MRFMVSIGCCFLLLTGCVSMIDLTKTPEKNLIAGISISMEGTPLFGWKEDNDRLRAEIIKRHPEWPEKIKNQIRSGTVTIGMTKQQVLSSWGRPSDINRTVWSSGTREQWVYNDSYLYFENGKLTSWQD